MATATSPAQWFQRFDSWRASGLSQAEWCRLNGVKLKTFENARTRLGTKIALDVDDKTTTTAHEVLNQPTGLIRLQVTEELMQIGRRGFSVEGPHSSGVSIAIGSHRIDLAPNFDLSVLRRLLAALEDQLTLVDRQSQAFHDGVFFPSPTATQSLFFKPLKLSDEKPNC